MGQKDGWSIEDKNFLIENYSNKGLDFCISRLKYTKKQIYGKAYGLNLKIKSDIKKRYKGKPNNLCNINPDLFIDIKTREIAYLLGLLWSDGYLNYYNNNYHIVLNMVEEDILVIKPILDTIGKWHFNFGTRSSISGKKVIRVSTNNKRIFNFLENNDYRIKSKVSADKILNRIPEKLQSYFFLGVIDGDGCYYYRNNDNKITRQFSIASTYDYNWLYVEKLFIQMDIKYKIKRVKRKNSSYSMVRVCNLDGITKIGKFIYKDDFIGLKRKYEKYLKLIH